MEETRYKLSALLMNTSEEKHLKVDIILESSEDVGLSSLQKPCVKEIWQHPSEGIIMILLEGCKEPNELEDYEECIPQIYQGVLDALDLKTYYTFNYGDGAIEEVELTNEEFEEYKADEYSIFESYEEAVEFANEEL